METVREGKAPPNQVTCTGKNCYDQGSGGCGAVLRFEQSDLRTVLVGGGCGGPSRTVQVAVTCPHCGVTTQLHWMHKERLRDLGWDIPDKRSLTY